MIRFLAEPDIATATKLLQESWRMHAKEGRLLDLQTMLDWPIADKLRERITLPEWGVFVAEVDDKVAGVVMSCIEEAPSYFKYDKQLFVHEIAVHPGYRRQGIADQLIQAVESFGKGQGVTLLVADIYDFNEPSKALFGKNGFSPDISYWYKVDKEVA